MTRPTYGSLFSGVGGMDMGFDSYMDCAFQVEWDKNCQNILHRHWPDVPKWGDVQEVNGADIPPCDVLTFGSPCQDLSVAGKRAGIEGGRSSMFFEAVRIIKEMRDATSSRPTGSVPRIAVWENVAGALSSNNGQDFQAVIDALADIGALDIQWSVLDAQHFGVPQRRRRVFLIAVFDPAIAGRCPNQILPVIEGRPRDYSKGRKKGEASPGGSVEGVAGGSVVPFVKARRAQNVDDVETWVEGVVAPTLNAFDNGGESRATVLIPTSVNVVNEAEDGVVGCLNSAGNSGGFRTEPGEHLVVVEEMNSDASVTVFQPGAMVRLGGHVWDDQVPTLRAEAKRGDNEPHIVQPIPIHDQATRWAGSNGKVDGVGKGNGFGVGDPGDPMNTLTSTDRHAVAQPVVYDGYNNEPVNDGTSTTVRVKSNTTDFVAQPIVYDGYNQSLDESGTHRTLRIGRDSSDFVAQPIIFDGTRNDDFRMDTEIVPTLKQRMGTGGGQVPMLAEPVVTHDVIETLKARTHKGVNTEEAVGGQLITYSFDTQFGSNANVFQDETPPLKASQTAPSVNLSYAVRRLTPLECERLMGYPDDHTRWTADGKEQADTHRYKQCGNGVATPVARWIAMHLKELL